MFIVVSMVAVCFGALPEPVIYLPFDSLDGVTNAYENYGTAGVNNNPLRLRASTVDDSYKPTINTAAGMRMDGLDHTTPGMGDAGGDGGVLRYGWVGATESPMEDAINGLKSFTFTCWVHTQGLLMTDDATLFKRGDYPDTQITVKATPSGSGLQLGVGGTGCSSPGWYGYTDQWMFIAISYDGTSTTGVGNVKFYRGRELVYEDPNYVVLVEADGFMPSTITTDRCITVANHGYNDTNMTRNFSAYIDEIRLYGSKTDDSGVLTMDEIGEVKALTFANKTIYQKWDSSNWTTDIGSEADPSTVITPLLGGKHYLYTNLYRTTVNQGKAAIYTSLDSDVVPAGTTAGNVTPFWLEFDYRFKGANSSYNTFIGVFNASGDNDGNPPINWLGAHLAASNVRGLTRDSANGAQSETAEISGGGTNVLHRIKMRVYNSGGKTYLDTTLYSIHEETFELTELGEVLGHLVLDTGESYPQGLDSFGIRNTDYPPGTHAQYDFDNCYFSTISANVDHPVPSFATLCVSSVLDSGSICFDPWNTTRWAAWYSGSKLVKQFAIDCNVTLADRGGPSSPWEPDISSLSLGRIFYIDSCSRGKTFDGNDQFIDVRDDKPTLYMLYNYTWLYPDSARHPLLYCFYCSASDQSGVGATVIKDLWIKGCVQAVRTGGGQSHPLTIQGIDFRRNRWGIYLSGTNTTVTGCGIKESAKGGMYLGAGSRYNDIIGNIWRDSNYEKSMLHAEICIDSSYGNYFENNEHQAPTEGNYHVAAKLYRNMGESGNLRENSAHDNVFIGNSINGYSVGYEVGSRMGQDRDNDISDEARDYAPYNLFEDNTISNTTFGIKLNCSGNEVSGNSFSSVTYPILLHNVFFSLTETAINNQSGTKVSYWFKSSDYTGNSTYSDWFYLQNDRNGSIAVADRYTHLSYSGGTPNFDSYSDTATLLKSPSQIIGSDDPVPDITYDRFVSLADISILGLNWLRTDCNAGNNYCDGADLTQGGVVNITDLRLMCEQWLDGDDMADVYKSGGTPIDVAVGDFWVDNPGDEIAVIWDHTTSMIDGNSYYTIIIYDKNGMEVNRCGRSTTKWRAITTGNFTGHKGVEIAAIPETAVGGYYPIYIFARGRKTATQTALSTNTVKINALAGGNFKTTSDDYHEVAYVLSNSLTTIRYCKPNDAGWSTTTIGAVSVVDLVAGNFDLNTSNGDEVAVMHSSYSRAYYYRPGATTYHSYSGPSSGSAIKAIAAGDFDNDSYPEIALALATATGGEYPIRCYSQGSTTHFKEIKQDVQGVYARAIAGGTVVIGETLGIYERVQGFTSGDYGDTIEDWGECVIMLPSAAQTTAIPAFILNADMADDDKEYLKVTPIVR